MGLLQTLGGGQGYLKAGFLGFAKSGKTWTAVELALGTRAHFNLKGPIGVYDTEGGVEYVAPRIREVTGMDPVGLKSRSLQDLIAVARECETSGVSVLVADSMTHVWREVCGSALQEINKQRERYKKNPISKLEFQHWGPVKDKWSEWTDIYLNSRLHIVICGRAGFEYDFEENDQGKKELVKTGTKMKTEAEFGFEPSLLIEMERVKLDHGITHRAMVLGDRFNLIDGRTFDNPTFDFFLPPVERLSPAAHTAIDTTTKTALGLDQDGDAEWQRERRQRTILCEEVQAMLTRHYPGQTAVEKKAKADLVREFFGTGSWTKVESMRADELRFGLEALKVRLEGAAVLAAATAPAAEEQAREPGAEG